MNMDCFIKGLFRPLISVSEVLWFSMYVLLFFAKFTPKYFIIFELSWMQLYS